MITFTLANLEELLFVYLSVRSLFILYACLFVCFIEFVILFSKSINKLVVCEFENIIYSTYSATL